MKKIGLGALLVLLAALIFAPTSSAAQLSLATSSLKAFAGPSACATLPLTVTSGPAQGSKITTMLIQGVPAACQGLSFELTAYDATGGKVAWSVAPPSTMSAGVTTITLNAKIKPGDVTGGIALTIGERGIKTVWVP